MAEDGTWPAIQSRGLLSTEALVDLYQPEPHIRASILGAVRTNSVILQHPTLGPAVIRDQRPLKFLDRCLESGTTPEDYLAALNGRVFFWLTPERVRRLLGARRYRIKPQTVLHVDTARLLHRYGDQVQLAPYNTGSMHVPNAPRRGIDVFVDLDKYPYAKWRACRGSRSDAVVELTVPYAVPDVSDFVVKVERWNDGALAEAFYLGRA
jgi:hypothetical protein